MGVFIYNFNFVKSHHCRTFSRKKNSESISSCFSLVFFGKLCMCVCASSYFPLVICTRKNFFVTNTPFSYRLFRFKAKIIERPKKFFSPNFAFIYFTISPKSCISGCSASFVSLLLISQLSKLETNPIESSSKLYKIESEPPFFHYIFLRFLQFFTPNAEKNENFLFAPASLRHSQHLMCMH